MKKHDNNYDGASYNITIADNGYVLTSYNICNNKVKCFLSFEELVKELADRFGIVSSKEKLFIDVYPKDKEKISYD